MSSTAAGGRGQSGTRWEALGRLPSAVWIAGALTVLAFGLRWACVEQSLFGDELFLWAIVDERSLDDALSVVHDTEKTPPLGFILSWLPTRLSEAPEVVRAPSFVAGVATVPLIYMLGLRTLGAGAAVVGAAWFALSPFEIFYGTEARSYAQVAALVVLSTLALLVALENRRKRWWTLYALAAAAAVYSHYIAVLTLIPQAAWALWTHRETVRQQLAAGALALLLFLPWLPSFVVQARNSADEARRISEMVPLNLSNLAEFSVKPLVAHPFVPLSALPGRVPLAVLAALLVGLAISLAVEMRRRSSGLRHVFLTPAGLVVILALVPLVGLVLYSLRPNTSFLLPRNLAIAVPYALLLIGWLLTFPRPRAVAVVLSLAALAALSVGTVKVLDPGYQRPDAADAARFVDTRGPASAPVVDVPGPHAIRTYLQPSRPVYTTPEFGPAEWADAARAGSPVFFSFPDVGAVGDGLGPPDRYAGRFRLVDEHTAPGVPFEIGIRQYAPR